MDGGMEGWGMDGGRYGWMDGWMDFNILKLLQNHFSRYMIC